MKNTVATQREPQVRKEDNQVDRPYQSDRPFLSPEVNIFETKDGFVLEAEMPGVTKEGLDITLEGNNLTILGRRNTEFPGVEALYRESKPANFRRVFELDPSLETSKISAKVEQGVLTLTLPKAEKVKPRKITVG